MAQNNTHYGNVKVKTAVANDAGCNMRGEAFAEDAAK